MASICIWRAELASIRASLIASRLPGGGGRGVYWEGEAAWRTAMEGEAAWRTAVSPVASHSLSQPATASVPGLPAPFGDPSLSGPS
jgi:hypothetical protein